MTSSSAWYVGVAFALLSLGMTSAASQLPAASVSTVLDVVEGVFATTDFIVRLSSERSDQGIPPSPSEQDQMRGRLEARTRELFAEPELSARLENVLKGSTFTWRRGFSDLAGIPFAPSVVSQLSADRVSVRVQREGIEDFTVHSAADVAEVYRNFPIKNASRQEVEARLRSLGLNGDLVLRVVALKTFTVAMNLENGRWKVSRIDSRVDFASVLIDS